MTLVELLDALGALIAAGTPPADIAQQMRNHAAAKAAAQELMNVGAGKKKGEMDADIARLTRERDDAVTERDEAKSQLEEFKAKTPDAATIEARLGKVHERQIRAKDDTIAEKDRVLKGALVRGHREKLVRVLVTTHRVDPDYASEVLALKHADRLKANDDGSVSRHSRASPPRS